MRRIMAIFAHPDDEGAIAGTLTYYAQNDIEVVLVCTTRGEVGEISEPTLATPETLGQVRQKELETACEILGIRHLEFLGYRDSGMAGTPENDDPSAFMNANEADVTAQLVGLMQKYQPDIVITFEPFGWYGHPDHQVASRWATAAFEVAKNSISDKLQRLFHAVIPFSKFRAMIQTAIEAGLLEAPSFSANIPEEQQLQTEAAVTHVIDVRALFDVKQRARMVHRTQFSEDNMFRKIPKGMLLKALGDEHFIQVYPKPTETLSQNRMTDLFANL